MSKFKFKFIFFKKNIFFNIWEIKVWGSKTVEFELKRLEINIFGVGRSCEMKVLKKRCV